MTDDRLLIALEIIRERLCAETELLDGAGYATPSADAAQLAASLLPDGSWADVDYHDDNLKDWAPAQHLSRLRSLTRGWYQSAAPHHHDAIHQAILRGLDGWYTRAPQSSNWWWNQIGAPLLLGETLLCLKGACDPSYITRAIPAFQCHEPTTRFTGQNLVWVATVQIYHGILTDEPERVSQGFIHIGQEVRIFPDDEGLQPDMSFHQHGKLLYSGGYGQSFVADVGRIFALAAGTAYACPSRLVDRFAQYVLDGSRWMVRGRTFDHSATGREITREGHAATRFYTGLRYLSGFVHARQAEAQASAAIDPRSGGSLVTGNRHFWCSDFMVQHRPAYYLSVRMPSTRLLNADWACGGGEGRWCHHMVDGATFIMCDGDEYRDLYPVWNWQQIPGTTVVQQPGDFDPDSLRNCGERAFAGGASDGNVGCAAMDFSRADLTARKAWFLFDEGMVALGAGITASGDALVRTTLNQCHWRGPALLAGTETPLPAGTYRLATGAAFWQDGVTYRVLDGTGTLRLGPQSGAWNECGVGSAHPLTLNVMNAGLEHGVKPAGATYAYAVLPGIEADAAFADDPVRFVILRNDPTVQAVWHADDQRGHAVFYTPGTLTFPDGQQIGVDLPCILLYHPRADGGATLTLAQPEQRDGVITLILTGHIAATLSISLPPREYAGSSLTVVWHPAGAMSSYPR